MNQTLLYPVTGQPTLSVVIPLYNESETFSQAFEHIRHCLDDLNESYELIYVDDGSMDETWQLIEAESKKHPVVGVRLSRNFGKEAALAAGINKARGRAVITMDGDLQHPPDLVVEMVRLWKEEGVEVVEAYKETRGNESFFYRFGAGLFYGAMDKMAGLRLSNASDFKLLDRRFVDAWSTLGERNLFFRGMCSWLGFKRREVRFQVPVRVAGSSRWSLSRLTRLALNGITAYSSLPLHFTTLLGIAFLTFSLIMGVHTLYMKMIGEAVSGFATVILLLLMVGSCILISLGIIGEYLGRIYEEVKQRPRYLVSSVCGGSHD